MSAEAGSAGSIALGAVLIIVGAFTIEAGGGWLILQGALLIAGGAIGLAFQPKVDSPSGAKARQLEIATASEGFPIPVIFGEQKITGNYMQYQKDFFRNKKIFGQPVAGGGKGGGSDAPKGVIGFDYYLAYEYGLCMGPIDSCMQVWSAPGEVPMREDNPVAELGYAVGQDFIEVDLQAHQEGGIARLYRGNPNQVRNNSGGSDPYVQDFIDSVEVVTGGTGYAGNTAAVVTGDGAGAEVTLTIEAGVIVSCRVTKRGYGYTAAAIVLSNVGSGAGATFLVAILGKTMNYRNVCFALMGPGAFTQNTGGFKIGRFPQPKSYQFILRRLPGSFDATGIGAKAMRRDDYSVIAGFEVRGSNDATKAGYIQANPAAVVYEIMTNKLWGRGLPSTMINEDSFVAASQYFLARHIGISYTLDSAQKLTELLDIIRTHLKTILVWDGETVKMRVLMDPAETKATIQTLTESEISGLRISRPDWTQTFNELRAEYNNAARNYRPDLIHVIDGANVAINGGRINPVRIQLPAFTDFNIAWKQVQRMLREFTFPLATATFEMNMFRSNIEVGDTFRLQWKEFGSGTQTAYFTCLKKTEAGSANENVKITALEDIDLSGVDTAESSITIPDKQPWELLPDLDVSKVGLFIVPGTINDAVFPIAVFELSPLVTVGKSQCIFLGQKGNQGVTGFEINWKQTRDDFLFLEQYDSFAITGNLATAISGTDYFDRSTLGAFDFSLNDPQHDEGPLLAACSRVVLSTDSLETLLDDAAAYMWIEEECIQIGNVQRIGINMYRAFNVLRGANGTDIAIHPVQARFYFYDGMPFKVPCGKNEGFSFDKSGPITQFQVNPIGTISKTETGTPFSPLHAGGEIVFDSGSETFVEESNNEHLLGVGIKPLTPIPISKLFQSTTADGELWTFVLRPRTFHKGAGTKPFFEAINELNSELDNLEWLMKQLNADGEPIADAGGLLFQNARPPTKNKTDVKLRPEELIDKEGGLVTIENVEVFPDCVEVQFFVRLAGTRSVNPARFYFT